MIILGIATALALYPAAAVVAAIGLFLWTGYVLLRGLAAGARAVRP